jgi:hypothetical protein
VAANLSPGMDGKVGGSACYASKWLDYLDPLIEQKITETGAYTLVVIVYALLVQQHEYLSRIEISSPRGWVVF